MAEKIRKIETRLQSLESGYDHGLITRSEFDEMSSSVIFELKLLINKI